MNPGDALYNRIVRVELEDAEVRRLLETEGPAIIERLLARGWNLSQLAKEIDYKQPYLSNAQHGKQPMSFNLYRSLRNLERIHEQQDREKESAASPTPGYAGREETGGSDF